MAKAKSIFVCLGKCPACNAWNTFYEEKVQAVTSSRSEY